MSEREADDLLDDVRTLIEDGMGMCLPSEDILNNVRVALRSAATPAHGYAQGQPAAWRYRFEMKNGVWGKWTVQKNKPTWYQPDQSDVEIEPLYAVLPATAGVEVTVEELAELLPWSSTPLAEALLSRFTILAKPAQKGQGS